MTTPSQNDFSGIVEELTAAFEIYYATNSSPSAMSTEVMKIDQETGDIAMDRIWLVLLHPTAYECLRELLPFLHQNETRAILADVVQEVLDRLEDGEQNAGRLPTED